LYISGTPKQRKARDSTEPSVVFFSQQKGHDSREKRRREAQVSTGLGGEDPAARAPTSHRLKPDELVFFNDKRPEGPGSHINNKRWGYKILQANPS
jgi:hypothetical protein